MIVIGLRILIIGMLCIAVPKLYSEIPLGQQKPKRKTKVEATYNDLKNETIARVGPFELWKPLQNSLSGEISAARVDLLVSFSYPGKKIVTPKLVTVMIFSTSEKTGAFESQAIGDFEKRRAFSVFTISGRHDFGEMEMVGSGKGQGVSKGFLVREVLKKDLPLNDFEQIVESEKVEIKIGDRKFKLTKQHLEAFRNLVSLMKEEGLEF